MSTGSAPERHRCISPERNACATLGVWCFSRSLGWPSPMASACWPSPRSRPTRCAHGGVAGNAARKIVKPPGMTSSLKRLALHIPAADRTTFVAPSACRQAPYHEDGDRSERKRLPCCSVSYPRLARGPGMAAGSAPERATAAQAVAYVVATAGAASASAAAITDATGMWATPAPSSAASRHRNGCAHRSPKSSSKTPRIRNPRTGYQ